ncbi:DUF6338 family protein [Ilumatobacter sp.]|uniref:DUF6338 family protein n=1 Tax=Ilumatobacter sp. TaxID=1967498 RepID=UPI003751DF66
MPSSFQAVAVLVFALLPGALYVWSFERQAGRYGIGASDRVLRFIGVSAIFLAFLAAPLYWLYSRFWDRFVSGEDLPLALATIPILYIATPILIGTTIGVGLRRGRRWVRWLTGPDPAPRAWDHLFQYRQDGWIRCRMKSGVWLAGAYATANGRQSYSAGYPEEQDLYLAATVAVDPETGAFEIDDKGDPVVGSGGLLLQWSEIEYLEFIDA